MSHRSFPPPGTKVDINVFPEDGGWSYEVGTTDPALHKVYGNPLDYDWTCDDEAEARMTAEMFCRSNGLEINEVRVYAGR